MEKTLDCVVCGSCLVDIYVRPLPLDKPIGVGTLHAVEPIEVTTGGLVCNSGIAMARLGMRVAAFSWLGDDDWATLIRKRCREEGVDTNYLLTHAECPTGATAVLVDTTREHGFAYYEGAWARMDRRVFLDNLDLFAQSRMALLGYYSLLPNLDRDLPEVLSAIRETGCRVALDTAGSGGSLEPLDRSLEHLDFYIPSYDEARSQTGETDPEKMVAVYRACGARGLLGIKLGSKGALLSPSTGEFIPLAAVPPPGPLVDTTGAGDSFFAGLLSGLLRGLSVEEAGRLAAAAGACCVTGVGPSAGLRNFEETAALAGLDI